MPSCHFTTETRRTRRPFGRRLRDFYVLMVYAVGGLFAAWSVSGCGYVLVKVTPLLPTPTSTMPVRLSIARPRSTSTLIPSTPLPTATATATSTPVVHIIQEGDNLLALAYRYDVSVQTLIEVNQIANPRALQIGQTLIIPPDDVSLLAAQPTATSTPMPLRVVNLAFHRTPVGSLWCMGEVENEREESLELVQLQVSLYNAAGEPIGRATSFTATDVVPGHGKAPFALLFPHPPAEHASYQIVVLSAEPITHWGRRHRALTVGQITGTMIEDTFVVQGVVHNRGEMNAEDVRVTVTAYGNDGVVVGVRQVEAGQLASGEHHTFTLSLIPAMPAAHVEAVAWGLQEIR